MKIGLMGGSFDPIHLGHTSIVEKAIELFGLDQFYFIPTGQNPWKDQQNVADEHRIRMIEIAIKKINSDKYQLATKLSYQEAVCDGRLGYEILHPNQIPFRIERDREKQPSKDNKGEEEPSI